MIVAASAPAAAVVCQPQGDGIRVDVAVKVAPASLHHDLDRARLGELSFHGPRDGVLGLATARLRVTVDASYKSRQVADAHCIWISALDAKLHYTALDLYIAAEYAPASCPYKAILAHERKHVEIARRHLEGTVRELRSALAALSVPKASAPVLVERPAEARAEMEAMVSALLEPVLARARRTLAEAQNEADSAEEYRRILRQCSTW